MYDRRSVILRVKVYMHVSCDIYNNTFLHEQKKKKT